jgi:hypothetical protein
MGTHGDALTKYRILPPKGQVRGSNPLWDTTSKLYSYSSNQNMPLQLLFNTHKLNHLSIQEMHDAFISHRNALLRSNKIKSIAFSLFCCHVALLKASHFANTPAYQTITASLDRHLKTLDEFVNREPINNSIENKRLVLEQINYSLKLWHDAFRAATAKTQRDGCKKAFTSCKAKCKNLKSDKQSGCRKLCREARDSCNK